LRSTCGQQWATADGGNRAAADQLDYKVMARGETQVLAQNCKTAEELGIKQLEWEALREVLVLLEMGELKHHDPFESDGSGNFNMSVWQSNYDDENCGTVACIGGTAELIGNFSFDETDANEELDNLFFVHGCNTNIASISTAHAARALRNYLTDGTADWISVLQNQK
jgi:hypothetical protein